jgi:hypothetical protein
VDPAARPARQPGHQHAPEAISLSVEHHDKPISMRLKPERPLLHGIERVPVEIGRIISSTDELLEQANSVGGSDPVLHFTHTVTYLRTLATQLSREEFDENLSRRIEDETRRLMA